MKTNLLLLALAILFATSCGDDSDSDSLNGTWQLRTISTTGCDMDEINFSLELDDDGCADQDGVQLCLLQLFSFNDNGSLITQLSVDIPGFEVLGLDLDDLDLDLGEIVGDSSGTWTMISDSVIEVCDEVEGCSEASFTLSDDRLTLFDLGETESSNCMTNFVYERI